MFVEGFEKYLRERLNDGVELSFSEGYGHWNLEFVDKEDMSLNLRLFSHDSSDRGGENDFIVFSKHIPDLEDINPIVTEYYLEMVDNDHDDDSNYLEGLMALGYDDDPQYYEFWWFLANDVKSNPWLANYFDLTKPR